MVARATGISRTRIARGIEELRSEDRLGLGRTRRAGGGRKRIVDTDPTLVSDLNALREPITARESDDSPLRWTSKSVSKLTAELQALGHAAGRRVVNELWHHLGHTLQANCKNTEGTQRPDRDAQFNYLNEQVRSAQQQGHPVISVDTEKKELVGEFKSGGREWRAKGDPEQVKVHDFVIAEQGKAIPYGVYDLSRDEGWVSVGVDHDTAHFAVNAIPSWWNRMGRSAYGGTSHLVIAAHAGGSNSPRTRLWKWELQRFVNRTGLTITVCHYPPGHQQVETHRAPAVLLHRHELARQAAGQSGYRGQSDRRHDDTQRPAGALGDRYALVPSRVEGDQRANAAHQSFTA